MKTTTKGRLEKAAKWGAGLLAGVLAVFGLRKVLGKIDDDGEAAPKPPGPSPAPAGKSVGNPPNISGDSAGYNTGMFEYPNMIRHVMGNRLGYAVEQGTLQKDPAVQLPPMDETSDKGIVKKFQRDYSRVAAQIRRGKYAADPSTPAVPRAALGKGGLDDDGIPGKYTMRALEIAWKNQVGSGEDWKTIVISAG